MYQNIVKKCVDEIFLTAYSIQNILNVLLNNCFIHQISNNIQIC